MRKAWNVIGMRKAKIETALMIARTLTDTPYLNGASARFPGVLAAPTRAAAAPSGGKLHEFLTP
jgi:hypothetical protein